MESRFTRRGEGQIEIYWVELGRTSSFFLAQCIYVTDVRCFDVLHVDRDVPLHIWRTTN